MNPMGFGLDRQDASLQSGEASRRADDTAQYGAGMSRTADAVVACDTGGPGVGGECRQLNSITIS